MAALKGIPQGIALGLVAGVLLYTGVAAIGALGMASAAAWLHGAFGAFIYGAAGGFNPAAIICFNTVLTAVGNFITGGTIAVNAHKQQIDHDANVARLTQLEGRERQLEQHVPPRSRAVQQIVENGPRYATSFTDAEQTRAAQAPVSPTIH